MYAEEFVLGLSKSVSCAKDPEGERVPYDAIEIPAEEVVIVEALQAAKAFR